MSILFDPIKEKALELAVWPLRGGTDFISSDYSLTWYFDHQDDRITHMLPSGGAAIMTAQTDGRWKVARYIDGVQRNHLFIQAVEFEDAEELFNVFMEGCSRLYEVSPRLLQQLMNVHEGRTFHLGFIHAVPDMVNSSIQMFRTASKLVAGIVAAVVVSFVAFQPTVVAVADIGTQPAHPTHVANVQVRPRRVVEE